MAQQSAWVLLIGVNHTSNTSIHYAEKLAGRKQFIRWALTLQGVRECPAWPGCSDGFEDAAPAVGAITRKIQVGDSLVQALPLGPMVEAVVQLIHSDPLALLCARPDCGRCQAVRAAVVAS